MIELASLTTAARKMWAKRKWDEFQQSRVSNAVVRSVRAYDEPTNIDYDCNIDKSKWAATVDKKVNYLLARKPLCSEAQDLLDSLADFIRESATQLLLRGSLIWVVQGDDEGTQLRPFIMSDTIAIYKDKSKEEVACFIRKRVDVEITSDIGAETEVEYYELYYDGVRDTFCYAFPERDQIGEQLPDTSFIELLKTGDAPLYARVEGLLKAFDNSLKHQDETTQYNTDPLVEVRGYSGTPDEDLETVVKCSKIAKTEGTGGIAVHTRSMDSSAIELWQKRLLNEYYEATCVVGKENELQFAVSGKALDRLFVDMENDARRMAHILEEALKKYFREIGISDADIIWNTDRPVDDAAIINAIAQSAGILSTKTLIEQHPWVEDVEEELKRKDAESILGMEDLTEAAVDEEEI